MKTVNRRTVLAGGLATLAAPALAQSNLWADLADSARAFDQCRAMLVRQSGRTVVSEVFRGPGLGRAAPVKSVSKSIVAALAGAAIDRGEVASVNATIGQLAPQLIPAGADSRVADITVENLVTMQAGLERTSGANYGPWVNSRNWVANALGRPFVAEPGARMLYSTGSFHILGAILSEISDQSLLTLARRRLGDPLGVDIPAWTRDPQGYFLGGNEMALTLEAMVRFGEMYRQNGSYDGQQVLSTDWVQTSLIPRTRSQWSGLRYGYGWFLGNAAGVDYAMARGYGGQIICVAPDVALTLAITSDPTLPARSGGYFGDLKNLVERQVLPLARQQMG